MRPYNVVWLVTNKDCSVCHAHVLEPIKNHSCKLLMMLLKDVSVMKINQENMNKIVVPEIPLKLLFEIII